MGNAIESINTRVNKSVEAYDSDKRNGRNSDPEQTETAVAGRKRGRPRKQPEAAAAEKENIPRVVNVALPEADPEDPPSPTAAKKKRSTPKAAAAKKVGVTSDNVAGIIKAFGDVVGNREGFEIWKLDEKECKQIADPLSRIIARSEYLEKITDEYGDYIALTIAASTVVIPRMIVQVQTNKEKKLNDIEKQKEKKEHAKRATETRSEGNENRTIGTSDRRFNEPTSHGDKTINPEFHKSIPIIQG